MRRRVVFAFALAAGCVGRRSADLDSEATPLPRDVSIALERGPCHGTCPVYRVALDSAGRVTYEGKRFVRQEGAASGQVSPERVADLARDIEQSGYFALPDSFTPGVPSCAPYAADLPTVITDISLGDRHKRIVHDHGCTSAPDMLNTIERRIDDVAESSRWTKR